MDSPIFPQVAFFAGCLRYLREKRPSDAWPRRKSARRQTPAKSMHTPSFLSKQASTRFGRPNSHAEFLPRKKTRLQSYSHKLSKLRQQHPGTGPQKISPAIPLGRPCSPTNSRGPIDNSAAGRPFRQKGFAGRTRFDPTLPTTALGHCLPQIVLAPSGLACSPRNLPIR